MPSRHGCRSNLRVLIGLFQILLLLLIFGAAIILWRIRPTIDSGNLLTKGTDISLMMISNGVEVNFTIG